jgi:crotonobetaine/carnitine-CoA ligase
MRAGPWLTTPAGSWTYADVLAEVDRTAVGLASRGVVHGDRVSVLLPNGAETLFAWFGANRLGALFAPLNPQYTPHELAGQLRLTAPRVLVADSDDLRARARAACERLDEAQRPRLASPAELARDGHGAPTVTVRPDDVAVLLATSGTTGAPKAVMQTHRTYALTAEAFPWWVGLTDADRVLVVLPLFHINAQAYSTMGALGAGAGLAVLPRFSASRFWSDAARFEATQCNAVGAMLQILLKAEPAPAEREHALRAVYAALALPEPQHREFERRFGVTLGVGYGLSESTFGAVWPRGGPRPYGTMGALRQHPTLGAINRGRVVRDDGAEARDGELGESTGGCTRATSCGATATATSRSWRARRT